MGTTGFIIVMSILAIASVTAAIIRNRNFRKKEKLHEGLGETYGLSLAYASERSFTLFGTYQDYSLRIEPVELPNRSRETILEALKISIPMVNPQRKLFRAIKPLEELPHLDIIADLDQPSFVRHDLGEWLQITTNDLLFASLILSDDIKISLYDTFNKIDAGLVYIEDEELAFIFPELLTDPEQVASIEKMIQLIVDIKDELNR
ncbi:MAG: hypothetical protein AAFQ83_14715 [Bacteroidota bacterium]